MHRYEALILTVPEITADEAKTIEQQFDQLITSKKGSIISFERWGKYRLSYPVQKNDYGIYFLARFETTDSTLVLELNTLLGVKLHELIMRFIVTKLSAIKSLEYQRPPSVEEAPIREVGSFMKDNRMDSMSDNDSDHQEM